ncbi:LysR family transcriptional regulator [Tianweitania sp.]|uniref:LysR family transcriptional regulator n=1 Tax=Tianweitania sp. TaxID=2021634 RepID=UPI002897DCA4|nr:LysR family transcriptional regulator [Tianweitania sp.]
MRNLPHLSYLEAFEAAARHLSFTRAAEELNCTQAAISQRVRALEHFFSRPLFHRRSNGLELTDVGMAYLPGIADALDRAETATQGMLGAAAQTSLTVSAPLSFVILWLSRHLGQFSALHPQMELRVNSTIWTDPNVELADLSILLMDVSQREPEAIRLGQERLMLLCDPETAKQAQNRPRADWLNAHRLIYVEGRMQLLDRWAKTENIDVAPTSAAIKADNAATALDIAASAGGITTTLSSYAASYLKSGRLVAPFGVGEILPVALHVVPNSKRKRSRSAALFIQWLSGEIPFDRQI